MRATLEFQLPEDRDDHLTAVHAWRYRSTVAEVYTWIRSKLKYSDGLTDGERALLEELRKHLSEELDGLDV